MAKTSIQEPVTLGLVGCGRIAQSYLEVIAMEPHCRLVAVADVRENAAGSVGNQFGCPSFTDYRSMLEQMHPRAVVICTPPATHAEIARTCLGGGIHVLCEKPLAMNLAEAESMLSQADEGSALLMMGSKFRYVDDIVKAKGIADSGILGDVILFENVFCSKVDMRNRWNADRQTAGGGVLIDNGTHSVDIARFLLGPIVKVQAEEGKRVQGLDVEDTCRLYFRTEGDTMGIVDLSWSLNKERPAFVDLYGPEGTLSIGWQASKYRQSEKVDWVTFGHGYRKQEAFAGQVRNFVHSIHGVEQPLITQEDSLESVRVIEAAYKSLAVNKWVDV